MVDAENVVDMRRGAQRRPPNAAALLSPLLSL